MDAAALRAAERINVVGASGTGKSTFARQLAVVLELPCIEMDRLFWKENWQESPDAEFMPRLSSALAGSRWVLDGNYSRSSAIKWDRVQAVIWLDYSFCLTLRRAVSRAFSRAISQAELWPGTGNRESLRRSFFSRDSVLLWTIQSHGRLRIRYEACLTDSALSHIRFVRLRTPSAARALLAALAGSAADRQ